MLCVIDSGLLACFMNNDLRYPYLNRVDTCPTTSMLSVYHDLLPVIWLGMILVYRLFMLHKSHTVRLVIHILTVLVDVVD